MHDDDDFQQSLLLNSYTISAFLWSLLLLEWYGMVWSLNNTLLNFPARFSSVSKRVRSSSKGPLGGKGSKNIGLVALVLHCLKPDAMDVGQALLWDRLFTFFLLLL